MKGIFKFIIIVLIISFISGCVINYVDEVLYDYGLTGNWSAQSSSLSDNTLRIQNKIGKNITAVKYYVGELEPDWRSVSSYLITESNPLINNASIDFTIGNGSQIDIGSNSATSIWLKVNSGDDYLVGSFYYDASGANKWWLTVYSKK